MPQEMQGTRIAFDASDRDYLVDLTKAGDYLGPDDGRYTAGVPAVWFLLPIARDDDAHGPARSLHHICSPPHVFREEPDGTLTARESIGAGAGGPYYWHGYLTEGRWELNKSKP